MYVPKVSMRLVMMETKYRQLLWHCTSPPPCNLVLAGANQVNCSTSVCKACSADRGRGAPAAGNVT